ncbi:MAG: hypothetical protein H7Z10_08780 [Gemmatimonadaceae bacterium]|nr:hypothetical protein [Acetobacteraceae bacterium]
MISPLPLPEWLPDWVHVAVIVAGALVVLVFLMMPFAVFGVKSRLELIEARLDEIQGEIRSLALRLPEPDRDEAPAFFEPDRYGAQRPPIPPAPHDRPRPQGPSRTEPRLY